MDRQTDGWTDRQTGGQAAIRTAAGETKPAEGKGSLRDTVGLSTKLYWFIYLFILTKTSKPYTAYQHERILQIPLFGGIWKGNIRERGRVGPAAAGPRWERPHPAAVGQRRPPMRYSSDEENRL